MVILFLVSNTVELVPFILQLLS